MEQLLHWLLIQLVCIALLITIK